MVALSTEDFSGNPYELTPRQLEVLRLIADGVRDRHIADQLGVSSFTVNQHVRAILEKLDVNSRTEAAVKAIREGLIE